MSFEKRSSPRPRLVAISRSWRSPDRERTDTPPPASDGSTRDLRQKLGVFSDLRYVDLRLLEDEVQPGTRELGRRGVCEPKIVSRRHVPATPRARVYRGRVAIDAQHTLELTFVQNLISAPGYRASHREDRDELHTTPDLFKLFEFSVSDGPSVACW